jgi:hypothetical protein
MKRFKIVFSFVCLLGLLAFVPKSIDPIDNLVTSLQRWIDANPQEKVYLHTDKPYYALGDTLWFKAYVTIGSRHQLSKMSGALYVELINEKDSLLNTLKLPVVAGMAMGDFALGDEYQEGNFRVRAYTQWMRNAGEDYFFDKTFVVGDPLSLAEAGNPSGGKPGKKDKSNTMAGKTEQTGLAKSDVRFFPEGGNMVAGINSRIGFKAVGSNGLGVAVKGVVLDNSGAEVSELESLHAGMGVFNLIPEAGKSYQAKLTFTDGSQSTVELPKAIDQGYVLAVYQPSRDSILVRINASQSQYQLSPSVGLMVHSGGELIFGSQIRISKAVNSVWLLKKDFPSGIAQFTLFDYTGQALNERIAFIRTDDQMNLAVETPKRVYKSRERVDLELMASDKSGKAVAGNFSVSVIDESKAPSDEDAETTILSSLLLSSDIKGYIERPNYYFGKESGEVNKALDNLMLTQGYRRFTWKDILSTDPAAIAPKFNAESLGTEISGRMMTLSGKPVANGTVTVMSLTPGFIEQAKTNADGRFKYLPIMLGDSLRFAISGRTQKNGKKVEVVLDSLPGQLIGKNWNYPDFIWNISAYTEAYLINSSRQDEVLTQTGRPSRIQRLKEIRITAKRKDKESYATQGALTINEGSGDFTYRMEHAETCPTVGQCLIGKLPGVSFMPYSTTVNYPHYYNTLAKGYQPMEVILNGRLLTELDAGDVFDNNLVTAADIIRIETVTRNVALMNLYKRADGEPKPAIFIYTRKLKNVRYNPGVVNIKPKGFNNTREFYSPRYDRPGVGNQLPDLRSTIYWNPKVKTLESGRTSLSFFNADGPGTYKITVEGINAAGQLARTVYRYEVAGDVALANVQLPSASTTALVAAMQDLQGRMPAEKVYLHTDKPYYNLGDTLWFKAYLLDAKTLSASKRSGLLYVELADDTAEAVRRITIPIKDGVGYAQIPLIRKIFHEGGYTLRAYTNWMQNFGTDYFFTSRFYLGVPEQDTWLVNSGTRINRAAGKDQLFTELTLSHTDRSAVGLTQLEARIMEGDKQLYKEELQTTKDGTLKLTYDLSQKADGKNIRVELRSINAGDRDQRLSVPLNITRNQMIDLQFLPEGGKLVSGLRSVIGFKAIAENGKGVQVTGGIYNGKGSLVVKFSSLHKGMGAFSFTPLAGELYAAKLDQPQGVDRLYPFPVVNPVGTVMHAANAQNGDSVIVSMEASDELANTDSLWYLTATARGMVCYASQVKLGSANRIAVARNLFPAGIARFTLLRGKTPVNERMVFIPSGNELVIQMKTQKDSYYNKDSVSLEVDVRDAEGKPVHGNFSVSVTDDSQVQADTLGDQGILASMLVRSELRGMIENPAYYLEKGTEQAWRALDNLMLTQGWKGYDWKDAFAPPKLPQFLVEGRFKVTGLVKNIFNKPVPGAPVLISSQKPAFIREGITDAFGKYTFENLPPIDSGSFFIRAKTVKGRAMNFGEVTVDGFSPPKIPLSYKDQVLPWYVNATDAQLNYVNNVAKMAKERALKLGGIGLKEVKIKNRKKIRGSLNPVPLSMTDLSLDKQDIRESAVMNLYELLRQKLPGFKIDKDDGYAVMKVNKLLVNLYIDGVPYNDVFFLSDPYSTEELRAELSIFQVETFRGLEAIYSNNGRHYLTGAGGARRFQPGAAMRNMNASAAMAAAGGIPKYVYPGLKEYATVYVTTGMEVGWLRRNQSDMVSYRPLPLMHASEFYSPKYTVKDGTDRNADLRSTIFWKPELITDEHGKARISFYTSDIGGSYTVNVQGADLDGKIGSARSSIKVTRRSE